MVGYNLWRVEKNWFAPPPVASLAINRNQTLQMSWCPVVLNLSQVDADDVAQHVLFLFIFFFLKSACQFDWKVQNSK